MIEPLMSHGLFYRCPCYVSVSGNISGALLSMQGQKSLGFHQKYIIYLPKMNKGLTGLERLLMTEFSFLG